MTLSIFLKRQFKLTKLIRQVTDLLRDKCKENNFHFVCNDNVNQGVPMERWYPS